MATSDDVLRKVESMWPDPKERERTHQELEKYGVESHEREGPRVQLAILKLSDGRVGKVTELVGLAKRDYRDVLMWAEYPEESRALWACRANLSEAEQTRLGEIRKQDRAQYLVWLKTVKGDRARSILDHPTLSRRYFSPRREAPPDIFWIECNGARLACAYVAPHPGALTLVHFHGNGEVVADYLPDLAADLTAIGVNVLFAEYRGYGASSGDPGMARILDDIPAIVKALPVAPSRLVAFGRSVGSLYAVELVHRFPECAGLIIESGIADPLERILLRVRPEELGTTAAELAAEVRARFDPQEKIKDYPGPVLVLHAQDDSMVASSHALRNAGYAKRATLRLLPEGDHNSIFDENREEYLAALALFLKEIGTVFD